MALVVWCGLNVQLLDDLAWFSPCDMQMSIVVVSWLLAGWIDGGDLREYLM
jgi:hypothetical protein